MSEKAPSRLSGDEAIKKAFGEVFRQIRERSWVLHQDCRCASSSTSSVAKRRMPR